MYKCAKNNNSKNNQTNNSNYNNISNISGNNKYGVKKDCEFFHQIMQTSNKESLEIYDFKNQQTASAC